MLKLNEFSHNHHPPRMKMLAKYIIRGISVVYRNARSNNQKSESKDNPMDHPVIRKPVSHKQILLMILGLLSFLVFFYLLTLHPIPVWVTELINKPACALPCWENITPGVTSVKDVSKILQSVKGVNDIQGPVLISSEPNDTDVVVSWWMPLLFDKRGYQGFIYAKDENHPVQMISLYMDSADSTEISIEKIISEFGEPEYMNIYFCDEAFCSIHIIFPNKGMVLSMTLPRKDQTIEIMENSRIFSINFIPIGLESYWENFQWPFPADGESSIFKWQGYGIYSTEKNQSHEN